MLSLLEYLDSLVETIITKVNSKGERKKRKKCRPGFKLDGNKCVPITGTEKRTKKLAIKKAVRTKKQAGAGYQKKVTKKRNKAMKKRSSLGL